MAKTKKFVKKVKYFYADNSEYLGSPFGFYFEQIFVFILGLIFSPLVWMSWYFSELKGKRIVYWEEYKK